jgi:hypothetical protein
VAVVDKCSSPECPRNQTGCSCFGAGRTRILTTVGAAIPRSSMMDDRASWLREAISAKPNPEWPSHPPCKHLSVLKDAVDLLGDDRSSLPRRLGAFDRRPFVRSRALHVEATDLGSTPKRGPALQVGSPSALYPPLLRTPPFLSPVSHHSFSASLDSLVADRPTVVIHKSTCPFLTRE